MVPAAPLPHVQKMARSRSAVIAPVAAACLGLVSLRCGVAFVAAPGAALRGSTSASGGALHPAAVSGALLLTATPAHAGGMFDFGLTLPFVVITFLAMMFTLNTLWYGPVLAEQDDRNKKLLQTLSEATDTLAKADEIQAEYTTQIREARENAAKAVGDFRKKADARIQAKVDAIKKEGEAKVAKASFEIDADCEKRLKEASSKVAAESDALVKDTLRELQLA